MGVETAKNFIQAERHGFDLKEGLPPEKKWKVLKKLDPGVIHGQIISRIASSFYFVEQSVKIEELADELSGMEDIFAVGVINEKREVAGLITRKGLFDVLSRQFGRSLNKNRSVRDHLQSVRVFDSKSNIFAVSQEIGNELSSSRINYYLLADERLGFAGIFSSKDMLFYLSDITQKDIIMATRVQSSIVKEEKQVESSNFEFMGASRMAKGIGGDFYSIKEIERGRWIVSLCDVSGKGMSAALLSVIICGMSGIYDFKKGIKGFLSSLNDFIINSFEGERFITGIFIEFNENNGKIVIHDAGHSFIFLFRDNRLSQLKSKFESVPIGVQKNFEIKPNTFTVRKDDILIITSDGIAEQKNPSGEMYGLARFSKVIKENSGNSLKNIKDSVLDDVNFFRKNQPQDDDISVIILKYTG